MKRRLIYGVVLIALTLNLAIGAKLYLGSAEAAERDSAEPDLATAALSRRHQDVCL